MRQLADERDGQRVNAGAHVEDAAAGAASRLASPVSAGTRSVATACPVATEACPLVEGDLVRLRGLNL